MNYDKNLKERDEKGYVPPPEKPKHATTRGRFNVAIKNAAEHFIVDK